MFRCPQRQSLAKQGNRLESRAGGAPRSRGWKGPRCSRRVRRGAQEAVVRRGDPIQQRPVSLQRLGWQTRVRGVVVALGTQNLHHESRQENQRGRRVASRRPGTSEARERLMARVILHAVIHGRPSRRTASAVSSWAVTCTPSESRQPCSRVERARAGRTARAAGEA